MNRRRFLTLTACALATPAGAASVANWQGTGFGAALSLRLIGEDTHRARRTFRRVEAEVARIESLFSLHRDSAVTRLNRDGRLGWPSSDFRDLMTLCGRAHAATGGAFDPTVQPFWLAVAEGRDPAALGDVIGWDRVRVTEEEIRLSRGQALTFNGVAQGWAADRIAALLKAEGYGNALIDMGEVHGLGHRLDGRDWTAAIAAPDGARLGTVSLFDRAVATSSPGGTLIGAGRAHILGPAGQMPLWSTVSVSAPEAAIADALSTAFCLMDRRAIDGALTAFPGAKVEILA